MKHSRSHSWEWADFRDLTQGGWPREGARGNKTSIPRSCKQKLLPGSRAALWVLVSPPTASAVRTRLLGAPLQQPVQGWHAAFSYCGQSCLGASPPPWLPPPSPPRHPWAWKDASSQVSHGSGSVPYRGGRAGRLRFLTTRWTGQGGFSSALRTRPVQTLSNSAGLH